VQDVSTPAQVRPVENRVVEVPGKPRIRPDHQAGFARIVPEVIHHRVKSIPANDGRSWPGGILEDRPNNQAILIAPGSKGSFLL